MPIQMYDTENVEFKFSGLRRHLKDVRNRNAIMVNLACEQSSSGRSSFTEDDNTFFFKFFELIILVVTISISRKRIYLSWFPGGHFLRGLITKS